MRTPAIAHAAQLLLLSGAMTAVEGNFFAQAAKPLPARILSATNRHLNLLRARALLEGRKYVHI